MPSPNAWTEPVVIPPHPELLGAIGVALLALERSRGAAAEVRDLAGLANPAMRRIGQFTCQACGNHARSIASKWRGDGFPSAAAAACMRMSARRRTAALPRWSTWWEKGTR